VYQCAEKTGERIRLAIIERRIAGIAGIPGGTAHRIRH
jgi:hypothetical protein